MIIHLRFFNFFYFKYMEAGATGRVSRPVPWPVGEELWRGQGRVLIQHPPTVNTIAMVTLFKAYTAMITAVQVL